MTNYLSKFMLKGKTVYIVGGLGFIGVEILKACLDAFSTVIILDNNDKKWSSIKNEFYNYDYPPKFVHFDCTKLDSLESQFLKCVNLYGSPHVFINCSYPFFNDWINSNFSSITYKNFHEKCW